MRRDEIQARIAELDKKINDELADWNVALTAGDEVLFFPPVAGG